MNAALQNHNGKTIRFKLLSY